MEQKDFVWLFVILGLVTVGIWMLQNESYPIRQGLDLQGGLQVLLSAELPLDVEVTREDMDTSRQIIDQRVNALGVSEPLVQVYGDRQIVVELPGIDNPEEAIELIQETALLEFVDSGAQPLPAGMCIRTSLNLAPSRCEFAPGQDTTEPLATSAPEFETVMTGAALRDANVATTP